MKYFYAKQSSALAAHILLEEAGAHYEAVEVSIADGDHRTAAFLDVNPKGRIPALQTSEGIITENPAILEYIATTHPAACLMPQDRFSQAQARSLLGYICATVHVAFAHHKRGARWVSSDAALQDLKNKAPAELHTCAAHLESTLAFSPWALPHGFSLCDPYLYLIGGWMRGVGASLYDFPKLTAHAKAMESRPAVRAALEFYG
ncbi:glutathione S-transferase family protein [Yoonia sp. 208BN28-4]|uniref:glutathione S-transferase family protein n=1 Tax=Yoonia sp. 208BN28-4 TaxID=3126505 RepID=UPI00309A748A